MAWQSSSYSINNNNANDNKRLDILLHYNVDEFPTKRGQMTMRQFFFSSRLFVVRSGLHRCLTLSARPVISKFDGRHMNDAVSLDAERALSVFFIHDKHGHNYSLLANEIHCIFIHVNVSAVALSFSRSIFFLFFFFFSFVYFASSKLSLYFGQSTLWCSAMRHHKSRYIKIDNYINTWRTFPLSFRVACPSHSFLIFAPFDCESR